MESGSEREEKGMVGAEGEAGVVGEGKPLYVTNNALGVGRRERKE